MNRTELDLPRTRLAGLVIGGVLVVVAAVGVGLWSGPGAAGRPGVSQLGPLGVLLLAYLGAGVWAWKRRGVEVEASLRTGAVMGILLGIAGTANLTLEYLGNLRPPFNAIVPASEMGIMVLLFGAAASLTLRRSRPVTLALLAAVWSAVVGTSLICAYAFLLQLAVLQPQGIGSLGNIVDSAAQHMAIAPIVAVVAGAVAIAATLLHRSSRPRARLALALLDVVQGAVGIGLLVFAASLVRAERPPFVMGGMLLTAAALACAPAVLRVRSFESL
ncbi:MAG TPA: hypothetical protein VGH73_11225 [Thermoanaerobaculia bacterium]